MDFFADKKRLIPLIVIILLLTLSQFRYETVASKTKDDIVLKWVEDKWTGATWVKGYTVKISASRISNSPFSEDTTILITKIINIGYDVVIAAMVIWFGVIFFRYQKGNTRQTHRKEEEEVASNPYFNE